MEAMAYTFCPSQKLWPPGSSSNASGFCNEDKEGQIGNHSKCLNEL